MSKITVLAEGQITPSTDVLITELSQSNELPAVILLKWRARSVRHTSCHLGHRLSRWHGSLRGNQFRTTAMRRSSQRSSTFGVHTR
jgi:hypothetical protein